MCKGIKISIFRTSFLKAFVNMYVALSYLIIIWWVLTKFVRVVCLVFIQINMRCKWGVYVCIMIGTGKLLGKLLADGDNLSYINLVYSQMWLKRLKTKRIQSTLNINTFSSNQTLKWEHNLAWLLLARALPCVKWFGPLSSAIFTPIKISTSMHCRCGEEGHAHKGLHLGLT